MRRLPAGAAAIAWGIAALTGACARPSAAPAPLAAPPNALVRAESAYADLRALRDSLEVGLAAGRRKTAPSVSLIELAGRHDSLRAPREPRLALIDCSALSAEDRGALGIMRRALAEGLAPVTAMVVSADPSPSAPDCRFDARAVAAAPGGTDSLRRLTY